MAESIAATEQTRLDLEFFKDPAQLADYLELKWGYPCRPLALMRPYPFSPLHVRDLDYFYVRLEDPTGNQMVKDVDEGIRNYEKWIEDLGPEGHGPLPFDKLCKLLPVVVFWESDEGIMKYQRAEVNMTWINPEEIECVNVHLVDEGSDVWVPAELVFQPTVELLRIPKLAIQCALSQMIPTTGEAGHWDPNVDYAAILKGTKSVMNTVQFTSATQGVWAVSACVDEIDVGFHTMITLNISDLFTLPKLWVEDGENPAFRKFNYSRWIGIKVPCFALKSLTPPEVNLQLDIFTAFEISYGIYQYLESTPDIFSLPVSREKGSACLCRVDESDDMVRAEVMNITQDGSKKMYEVRLVDFNENKLVEESMIAHIPEKLKSYPECGVGVLIGELIPHSKYVPDRMLTKEQIAIVKNNLEKKDIICTILSTTYEWRDAKPAIVATISIAENKTDFVGRKLSEMLNIQDLSPFKIFKHFGPGINIGVASKALAVGSRYSPGVTYKALLSCAMSFSSVHLQIEDDAKRLELLTSEMTDFYSHYDKEEMNAILSCYFDILGLHVAVEVEVEGKLGWYRAIVLHHNEDSFQVQVQFIDFGDEDYVNLDIVRPLLPFFCKDPALATPVSIPVDGALIDEDSQSAAVLDYCEHGAVEVEVRLDKREQTMYAFIQKPGSPPLEKLAVEQNWATKYLE